MSSHTVRPPLEVSIVAADVTAILDRWCAGDHDALDQLMPLVHDELRAVARAQFVNERADHTLQPTALVHEAYLRLIGQRKVSWQGRAHFLNSMAVMMRRLLVDHARVRRAAKRGGGAATVLLDEALDTPIEQPLDLVRVDDALTALASFDERQARVVELRFFAGLTEVEIAEVLDVSAKTVQRDWNIARLWLLRELDPEAAR
ncbi:MAG: sigma-70 family RNA polymerase sigma factor [Acidobacteriota bacterium]